MLIRLLLIVLISLLPMSAQALNGRMMLGGVGSAEPPSLANSKIIAPSNGIYFGSHEWTNGDIAALEAAAGIHTSHFHSGRGHWGFGFVSGHPHLDVTAANTAWNAGRPIVVSAYNLYAGTDDEHPAGFTIDKLLAGDYDSNLHTFALELASFGKPLWMQAGREPNGIGADYYGGWGTDGTQSTSWAITNELAYNQFTPPAVPSGAPADLYAGCSGATMPDGIGRLKAAQRYLHDFFERREGLHFLTWDTQGWNVRYWKDGTDNQDQYDAADYPGNLAYALLVFQRANDFANFYPGDAYSDWVSLTWYFLDYYDADWSWLTGGDILLANADWITSLGHVYTQIQSVTAHPIILAEFGMPDGMNSNTVYGASKVTDGFNAILDTYTQIRGVSLWSNYEAWFMADSFPYDCNIRTGSLQATALQNVIAAHPEKFATCIRTTGNIMQPNCTP